MRTVWKFELPIVDNPAVEMPVGANVLHVETQRNVPRIWALVDPEAKAEHRAFRLLGTGRPRHADELGRFIGSFMMHDGVLVFHLFEAARQDGELVKGGA